MRITWGLGSAVAASMLASGPAIAGTSEVAIRPPAEIAALVPLDAGSAERERAVRRATTELVNRDPDLSCMRFDAQSVAVRTDAAVDREPVLIVVLANVTSVPEGATFQADVPVYVVKLPLVGGPALDIETRRGDWSAAKPGPR